MGALLTSPTFRQWFARYRAMVQHIEAHESRLEDPETYLLLRAGDHEAERDRCTTLANSLDHHFEPVAEYERSCIVADDCWTTKLRTEMLVEERRDFVGDLHAALAAAVRSTNVDLRHSQELLRDRLVRARRDLDHAVQLAQEAERAYFASSWRREAHWRSVAEDWREAQRAQLGALEHGNLIQRCRQRAALHRQPREVLGGAAVWELTLLEEQRRELAREGENHFGCTIVWGFIWFADATVRQRGVLLSAYSEPHRFNLSIEAGTAYEGTLNDQTLRLEPWLEAGVGDEDADRLTSFFEPSAPRKARSRAA